MTATPRKRALPIDLALANPSRPAQSLRSDFTSSLWQTDLSRQTAYRAHHSCVNALAIGPAEGGRWLASGGDDRRILLWDTTAEDQGAGVAAEPVASYVGAQSNLFAIAFSCDGQRIFAAGNDSSILEYDLETTRQVFPSPLHSGIPPCDGWFDHDDSIMGLAAHPTNPHLFLAASADGTLRSHDARSPDPVSILPDRCGMNDIAYHPLQPELMVYAGDDGQVGLLDARTAWRDPNSGPATHINLARDVAVVQYEARLTRRKTASDPLRSAYPGVSSAVFSPSGSVICATLSGHLPTLYELNDPSPLATFSSPGPPDSAPPARPSSPPPIKRHTALSFPHGYRNTTTTKHGSFGGPVGAAPGEGLLYAAGSDDFRAYVWKVPSLEALREQRCKVEKDQLQTGDIVFRKDDSAPFLRPASISPASSILTGHRSIVNTALFHPNLPLLYTSGVEKVIVRHSAPTTGLLTAPAPTSESTTASTVSAPPQPPPPPSWSFTPRAPASHYTHPGLFGPPDPALDTALQAGETPAQREVRLREEDVSVLEYFDGLVEGEGEEALWDEEGMRFAGDSESESGDEEDEELDSDEEAMVREILEGQGLEGTTRRMLNAIYQLRQTVGESSDEDDSSDESGESGGAVEERSGEDGE
ncbi:DDB1- and CUL4-associated factor 5 [Rhodotorula toruloides]|nr:DDB1- and CUL4-associated factor 5 [Rhodotorula toruloides]